MINEEKPIFLGSNQLLLAQTPSTTLTALFISVLM
jgi:hypothetical protein